MTKELLLMRKLRKVLRNRFWGDDMWFCKEDVMVGLEGLIDESVTKEKRKLLVKEMDVVLDNLGEDKWTCVGDLVELLGKVLFGE